MRVISKLVRLTPYGLAACLIFAGAAGAIFAGAAGLMVTEAAGAAAIGPPLVDAVRNGDTESLRDLLAQGADPNLGEADGTTALVWASYRDDGASADLLIQAGADVNRPNDLGATPLWAASQNGSETMVGRLLEAGADPNAALLLGETPIMVASRSGNRVVVEQLITEGGDVNARAARDQTALMWAAAQKHPDVVEVLLAHGADVHARSEVWSKVMAVVPHTYYNRDIPHGGDTALMFAARGGALSSARALVAAGANVNDADAWSVSAVSLAAHSGFTELVGFLLDAGADPNAAGPGFTALHNAIMHRDERMVSELLAHGADASAPLTTWTPSRRASLDFSFDPELVGASPLWLAAAFSSPAVMRLLLSHGADPLFVQQGSHMLVDVRGFRLQESTTVTTALMAALGMGGGRAWLQPEASLREALTLEAVGLALELGVDVNAANTEGRTALDAAMNLDYETVVDFLVENGAVRGTGPEETP